MEHTSTIDKSMMINVVISSHVTTLDAIVVDWSNRMAHARRLIHANEDDQITDVGNGGSGARIACGVIHGG